MEKESEKETEKEKGIQYIKLKNDKLSKYAEPDNNAKVEDLFGNRNLEDDLEEQDEQDGGIKYYCRKVLGQSLDKPDNNQLEQVSGDTEMDEVYDKLKTKGDKFTSPEEGIQLVKTIGNINPKEIDKHMNDTKSLYDKKDEDGNTSGTTVQSVKVTKPNKDGVNEPVQYIKAVRGGLKSGEDPISYYKFGGGVDIRDVLDQIQENGKPNGEDGVDYNKVKGDELPEVQKLFGGCKRRWS